MDRTELLHPANMQCGCIEKSLSCQPYTTKPLQPCSPPLKRAVGTTQTPRSKPPAVLEQAPSATTLASAEKSESDAKSVDQVCIDQLVEQLALQHAKFENERDELNKVVRYLMDEIACNRQDNASQAVVIGGCLGEEKESESPRMEMNPGYGVYADPDGRDESLAVDGGDALQVDASSPASGELISDSVTATNTFIAEKADLVKTLDAQSIVVEYAAITNTLANELQIVPSDLIAKIRILTCENDTLKSEKKTRLQGNQLNVDEGSEFQRAIGELNAHLTNRTNTKNHSETLGILDKISGIFAYVERQLAASRRRVASQNEMYQEMRALLVASATGQQVLDHASDEMFSLRSRIIELEEIIATSTY